MLHKCISSLLYMCILPLLCNKKRNVVLLTSDQKRYVICTVIKSLASRDRQYIVEYRGGGGRKKIDQGMLINLPSSSPFTNSSFTICYVSPSITCIYCRYTALSLDTRHDIYNIVCTLSIFIGGV